MPQLLACPNCNAPLPPPSGSFVTCGYCGATAAIAHGQATRVMSAGGYRDPAPPPPPPVTGATPRDRSIAAYKAVMDQRGGVERAVMHAANELAHARSDGVSAQEMGVGTLVLAQWFDAHEKTTIVKDAMAMNRLMEAVAKAIVELRSVQLTTINLPFLTADGTGPKHFERELDARTFASFFQQRR